jgi:sulfur carrier protein ThiS
MNITIRLCGNLKTQLNREMTKAGTIRCELAPQATVSVLLSQLDIPASSQPVVIQGNRVLQGTDLLIEKEEICIMQPLEGG